MILKKLTDQFIQRGLFGGSRVWFIVGGIGALLRLAGRVWDREPELLFRETLDPGEEIVITNEVHPKVLIREAKRADRDTKKAELKSLKASRKAARRQARQEHAEIVGSAGSDDSPLTTP